MSAQFKIRVTRDRATGRWRIDCEHPACCAAGWWPSRFTYPSKAAARHDARQHRRWHQGCHFPADRRGGAR